MEEHWHLDKKVPIGIIVALIAQTLVFVYVGTAWKVYIEGRVIALERSDTIQASHETRITVIEQGIIRVREDLAEIKAILRGQAAPAPENTK